MNYTWIVAGFFVVMFFTFAYLGYQIDQKVATKEVNQDE